MCFDKNYTFQCLFSFSRCSIFNDQDACSSQAFLLYYIAKKKSIDFFDFFRFFLIFLFLLILDTFSVDVLCSFANIIHCLIHA